MNMHQHKLKSFNCPEMWRNRPIWLPNTELSIHNEDLLLLSQFFKPLLGYTRCWGKFWATIRLPHRPEPSGCAIHEVDGLDIGGPHGWQFVLLRHTHRPQRRPYPICTNRSGHVQHWCGSAKPDPWCSWKGHSERVPVMEKCSVL